jgi:hypothetical protein
VLLVRLLLLCTAGNLKTAPACRSHRPTSWSLCVCVTSPDLLESSAPEPRRRHGRGNSPEAQQAPWRACWSAIDLTQAGWGARRVIVACGVRIAKSHGVGNWPPRQWTPARSKTNTTSVWVGPSMRVSRTQWCLLATAPACRPHRPTSWSLCLLGAPRRCEAAADGNSALKAVTGGYGLVTGDV